MIQEPLFLPERTWCPPCVFPTLGSVIAIDTETRDPHLKQTGPSFKRGEGEVVGIALADQHNTIYLPFAHEGGGNLDKNLVIRYVKNAVANATEVIMANALYDLGWLNTLGIEVACPVRDIQVAEALLDEERYSYSLNNLAKDYLGKGKDEGDLRLAADAYALANKNFSTKGDMWRLHSGYVGAYGEADARYTYDIYPLQLRRLSDENLLKVWELETSIIPIIKHMVKSGVPVDQNKAQQIRDEMYTEEMKIRKRHKGVSFESSIELADYLGTHGIKVPKTQKGNPSIKNDWLEHQTDPLIQEIAQARQLRKIRCDYIEGTILGDHYYNGRIHSEYRQCASDEGGTVTGRFSSKNPNTQQIPSRTVWGKKIRNCYIPEDGMLWCKSDYSSQEPRLQTHYAILENLSGAQEAKQAWIEGKKLYTFFEEVTGLPYATCKMLCLGIGYGMQSTTMSLKLGVSVEECDAIRSKFNRHAPWMQLLFDKMKSAAEQRGYIKTILGRKARFDSWSVGYGHDVYKTRELAEHNTKEPWRLSRQFGYKALNRCIQGGSADMTKTAMLHLWQAGFDIRMTVHDEVSCFVETPEQGKQVGEIMENVMQLEVPIVADLDIGDSWK